MSGFTVHGIAGSPYVRSALMGLEEKGIPYTFAPLGPGETKGTEHLKRHPFGRIPSLDHDGFQLYETQAILRYLDDLQPEPAFEPTEPHRAARMNQLVGIVDWYLFPQCSATIGFNRIVAPHFGLPVDEAVIAAAIPKAEICLAAIAELPGDGPYLVGDTPSLADLMLAPQLSFLAMTPEGKTLLARHTALSAWLDRMEQRDSMQRTRVAL